MFCTLTKVPVTKPKKPTVNRKMFLMSFHLNFPQSGQFVTVSIMGGAIRAKVEELTAPTSEISRSIFGIAAARATVENKFLVKNKSMGKCIVLIICFGAS